jgi:sugar (pentulose or hexulose) kinase
LSEAEWPLRYGMHECTADGECRESTAIAPARSHARNRILNRKAGAMNVRIGQRREGSIVRNAAAFMLLGGFGSALALAAPARFEDCIAIQADAERLACYDRLARRGTDAAAPSAPSAPSS